MNAKYRARASLIIEMRWALGASLRHNYRSTDGEELLSYCKVTTPVRTTSILDELVWCRFTDNRSSNIYTSIQG